MTMIDSIPLEQSILESWPLVLWQDSTVVVAASGGPDSTTLLEALLQLRPDPNRTVVAHFNHALRGKESDDDQAFVESHAKRLNIPCVVGRAKSNEISNPSENNLRKLRLQFLKDVAVCHSATWIAMAHHAGDQVETFLHHLLRGSGPCGLSSIQAFRTVSPQIVIARPLLRVQRSQILNYLADHKLEYCIDHSNASSAYTRNRIRNELLPMLRSFANSESLDLRLLQTCKLIAEEHAIIKELAVRWLASLGYTAEEPILSSQATHFTIPILMCRNEPWPVVREAMAILWHRMNWPLREMNHQHWRRVQKLIEFASQTTHPKRIDLPGRIAVRCRKGVLRIERFV